MYNLKRVLCRWHLLADFVRVYENEFGFTMWVLISKRGMKIDSNCWLGYRATREAGRQFLCRREQHVHRKIYEREKAAAAGQVVQRWAHAAGERR